MNNLIKIAVDAMGGDGSPKKIIDGLIYNHKKNKENFFQNLWEKNEIDNCLNNQINQNFFEIIDTDDVVKSTDSPLEAAKRGKKTKYVVIY